MYESREGFDDCPADSTVKKSFCTKDCSSALIALSFLNIQSLELIFRYKMAFINKSLLSFLLLSFLALKPAQAGELNPFDDDPVDTTTGSGGTGGGGTGGGGTGGGAKVYVCAADNGAKYTT